jgi:hypothetical protein
MLIFDYSKCLTKTAIKMSDKKKMRLNPKPVRTLLFDETIDILYRNSIKQNKSISCLIREAVEKEFPIPVQ